MILQLVDIGVVAGSETSGYSVSFDHIVFREKRHNQKQKEFLWEQLMLSMRAFKRLYNTEARFYTSFLTIEKSHYENLQEDIQEFVESIVSKYHSEEPDELAQVNIQLFPVTNEIS